MYDTHKLSKPLLGEGKRTEEKKEKKKGNISELLVSSVIDNLHSIIQAGSSPRRNPTPATI